MESFKNIRALIIDMDGVLWHGTQAMPGLVEFFKTLNDLDIRYILATNNASLTPEQYVTKLANMGVTVSQKQILTSGMATALYLSERVNPKETRVFVVGEDGATQPLLDLGFTLTGLYEVDNSDKPEQKGADIVVCGKDETLTWAKLATASLNIRAGASFIGTNADTTLPTEHGITHGNGAILAALEVATGVSPTIIGKPEPIIYQQALGLLGISPDETVALGDRLETDILGAVRTGIRSIMVLTGISSEADLQDSGYQPTWVMADIRAVTKALREQSV
ncbi:MAG: HAD-IIA family hydrolase [Methylococcales bacterium]|jgi:4-nitrophenyl phosphatase|nr:MAG: HAD-IIA family hydrolase [Methylococcales bacterium]